MGSATWWELEVSRLASEARLLEGDDLVVSREIDRDPTSFLPRAGFISPERLPEILAHVGAIPYPCPACRLLVEIGDRVPESAVACPGCGIAFAVPSPESWTPPARTEAGDRNGLLGEIVDGLRFDRILHQGHGTTVYRAWQMACDRPVAAKCLDAGRLADPETGDRLLQEVRLSIDLSHPNLVGVLGLLSRRNARVLVMEYVDGIPVDSLLGEERPLGAARAFHIARAIGRALGYLHGRGMVHRDVKPGNVLLGLEGEVSLGDFELLERFERRLAAVPDYLLGTPPYMSPEILKGGPPGPASDVYALGATLYHMLAGVPPYDADDPVAVAVAALRSPPPPIGARRPDLPPSIGRVVERLMARRVEARPSSGADLDAVLEDAESVLGEKSLAT